VRVTLKAGEEVVPPDLSQDHLGHGSHGGAARLLVNHAHFAKGFSRPKVSQVDPMPVVFLAHFDLPLFDNVGRVAHVVFLHNHFSSRILAQCNHNAASPWTLSARSLPDCTPARRQKDSGGGSVLQAALAVVAKLRPLRRSYRT